MITLREYIQNEINTLQQLLNENQDDAALIEAVKKQWPDKDAVSRALVFSLQTEINRLGSDSSNEPTGTERENVATPKFIDS